LVLLPLLLLTGFWAYDSEKFTAATCGDLTWETMVESIKKIMELLNAFVLQTA
jgi:hypothetical protein